MKKEKGLFVVVLISWTLIVSTFIHDIILALKYDMKVPQVKVEITPMDRIWHRGPISPGVIERLFPFCCLSRHQPTEWVPLWERLRNLLGFGFIWLTFITLSWILVKKGILTYNKDDC
jgi:hypothetical protein